MDALILDSNRNIATLSIITLLKTGTETNLEKLMKQITMFLGEIGDELKITIINEMKNMCLKSNKKHAIVLSFLNKALKVDGVGYDFKRTIIDTIISIIELNLNPETGDKNIKEQGIKELCDFIEDCEFTLLLQQILYFLGKFKI
jgi:coatomer subunit gamma